METATTTIGEYRVEIADKGVVKVYRIPKSTIAALKDCAAKQNFEVNEKWYAQALGRNLLKEFCNGENSGTIGEYHIERRDDNHIDVYQEFNNTKGALCEISKLIGFEYDEKWNTQHFGRQLVKFAEENGPFKTKMAKKTATNEKTSVAPKGKSKSKKGDVITFTLGGRIEVYRVDAVKEGCKIDEDDFDEDEPYNYYADEGLTNDNPLEFSLIYKRACGIIKQNGKIIKEWEEDDDDLYENHLADANWFGPRYAALRRQNVMSLMVPISYVEQDFKIQLQPGEKFDINELGLIDVSDDSLICQFEPEGFILCDYIVYKNKVIAAESKAFQGGRMKFKRSWLLQGGCEDNYLEIQFEDGFTDNSDDVASCTSDSTFTGEEYDSNEEELDLTDIGEEIKYLDLSKFKKLKTLDVSGLNIHELDLSNNPKLKDFYCSDCNYLTELDLTKAHNLKNLEVSSTKKMVKIDVSGLQLDNFSYESCGGSLTEVVMKGTVCNSLRLDGESPKNIDLSQLRSVKEFTDNRDNDETTLDISMLHNVERLNVSRQNIETIVLPNDGKLMEIKLDCGVKELDLTDYKALENVSLASCGGLQRLDVSGLKNLEKLSLSDSAELQSLTLGRNKKLKYLTVNAEALSSIDITQAPNLKTITLCGGNVGDELTLSGLDMVTDIHCDDINVKSIDFTCCEALESLYLSGCKSLGSIDVRGLAKLKKIDGRHFTGYSLQSLQTIKLKGNGALGHLECDASKLETPDFSEAVNIEKLIMENYQGKSIDLHKLTKLTELNLDSSPSLSALDVSALADLDTLSCNGCKKLGNVDLPVCSNLTQLYLNDTAISSIDISRCGKLMYLRLNNTAISSINLSSMPELVDLSCEGCKNLTEVDITKNPEMLELNINSKSIKKLIMKKGQTVYGINEDGERYDNYINDATKIIYK